MTGKLKSKKLWAVMVVIVIIVGIIGITLHNKKESLLNKTDINMKFSGYQGSGQYDFDLDKLYKTEMEIFTKKAKLSDYWTNKILESPRSTVDLDDLYSDGGNITAKDEDKLTKIAQWQKETNINWSSPNKLKNGQKVIISVKVSDDKTNPLKEESKSFKVKGLKQVKNIAIKNYVDKLQLKVKGTNTRGEFSNVKVNGKAPAILVNNIGDQFDTDKALSNGDQIKATEKEIADGLNKKSHKYHFIGRPNKTVTLTVKGLKNNVKYVSNLNEFLEKNVNMPNPNEFGNAKLIHAFMNKSNDSFYVIYKGSDIAHDDYRTYQFYDTSIQNGQLSTEKDEDYNQIFVTPERSMSDQYKNLVNSGTYNIQQK